MKLIHFGNSYAHQSASIAHAMNCGEKYTSVLKIMPTVHIYCNIIHFVKNHFNLKSSTYVSIFSHTNLHIFAKITAIERIGRISG